MLNPSLHQYFSNSSFYSHRKLQQEALVQFVGVVNDQGKFGIVTEFFESKSLNNYLRRRNNPDNNPRLSWSAKIGVLRNVGAGMKFIHSRGYTHHDLKSSNILIGEANRVKIGDFGLARALDKTNVILNNQERLWMAPEVIGGKGHYDKKCDVYSFGIIMWETLNENEPYHDIQDKQMVVDKIAKDPNFRPTIPNVEAVKEIHSTQEERRYIDTIFARYVSLMKECWSQNPSTRPTFDQVVDRLHGMRPDRVER